MTKVGLVKRMMPDSINDSVEKSVAVNNSPIQDYVHPDFMDDQLTYEEITPGNEMTSDSNFSCSCDVYVTLLDAWRDKTSSRQTDDV